MKIAFLLGYIAIMIFAFYKKGWKSWIPWFFCIVVFYDYDTFFTDSTKASSLNLNVADSSPEEQVDVVKEPENTRDGIYLLNGNSAEASITIIGDQWFYEYDNPNMPYLNTTESGNISGGVLYFDIVVRRGYFEDGNVIYQGYRLIKVSN